MQGVMRFEGSGSLQLLFSIPPYTKETTGDMILFNSGKSL